MIKIYCLVDPRNNKPFYIGATRLSLSTRVSGHVHIARQYMTHMPFRHNTLSARKHSIIYGLWKAGKRPKIIQLALIHKEAANHYEQFFYLTLRGQGYTLYQLSSAFNYLEQTRPPRYSSYYNEYKPIRLLGNNLTKIIME